MSSEFLDDRRKALEDEFFHKQSQKDLESMREKLVLQTSKEALRKASGMTDDAVLDKLVALGIGAQTIMALSIVPLVHVAWADGKVQPEERDAILQGAHKKGIEKGTEAHELLEDWLARKPADRLFDTWAAYIKALCEQLSAEEMQQLRSQVTRFARFVAESSGGFLGIGKVSDAEEQTLTRIEAAFDAGSQAS